MDALAKPTITAVNFYPLEEPLVGGSLRTYHLYRYINEDYKVNLIAMTNLYYKELTASGDLQVTTVEETEPPLYRLLRKINRRILKIKIAGAWPLVTFISAFFNEKYKKELRKSILNSQILISEHPYLFPTLHRTNHQLLVYNAHNVEYLRQKIIFGHSFWGKILSFCLRQFEKYVCRRAELIFATCAEDKEIFFRLYGVDKRKISVIPNGVDLASVRLVDEKGKAKAKEALGLSGQKVILFIGGYHLPNLEAVEFIVCSLAKQLPDFTFLILGRVEQYFSQKYKHKERPDNVIFKGVVSEEEKRLCFQAADLAINPMRSGSGTNIKVLEYMAYGLPVVTTSFGARGLKLKNGQTALICQQGEFAQNIRRLEDDQKLLQGLKTSARRMCEERYDWRKIAQKAVAVLNSNYMGAPMAIKKPKVVIVSYFPLLHPLPQGGQYRTFHLCKLLSRDHQVTLISPSYRRYQRPRKDELPSALTEVCVQKQSVLYQLLTIINKMVFKTKGCWPIATSILSSLDRRFLSKLKKEISAAKLIVLEHPYLFPALNRCRHGHPLIYDAHNVEFIYQKGQLENHFLGRLFLRYVQFIEERACRAAHLILASSAADKQAFNRLYKIPLDKITVICHGYDTARFRPCSGAEKAASKERLNLNGKKTALFIGSSHYPNLEAGEFILTQLAPQLKEVTFIVAGEVCAQFENKPEANLANVRFFGLIDEEEKKELFKAADIALNPLFHGSGTSVKMLDYMASGLPVVTTAVGARGLEVRDREEVLISPPQDFAAHIRLLLADGALYLKLSTNARRLVEAKYDWQLVNRHLLQAVRGCVQ